MSSENTSLFIDAVPPELWENIFLHAIPTPTPTQDLGDQDDRPRFNTSFVLSHTCARWRDITLSRPSFWNTVRVSFRVDKQSPNQHLVDLMIARSANTPLLIDLRMIDVDERTSTDPTCAGYLSLQKLSASIARWKELRLYLRGCSVPLALSEQLTATGALSLECVQLNARLELTESDGMLYNLWERSPRLHRLLVSVSNHPNFDFFRQVPQTLPYSRITSLHIHTYMSPHTSISLSVVVSVLHDAPNLVSCVMSNISTYHGSSVSSMTRSVNLPRLKYLHLAAPPANGPPELPLTDVFDYFTAPSLKVLAFSNMYMEMWGQDKFEAFIVRSGASLEELHIFNPHNFWQSTLIPILRGVPSIKGIHLGCLQKLLNEPLFIENMTAWNTSSREFELCPQLSTLSFHDPTSFDIEPDCDIDEPEMKILVAILKSRLDPPDGGESRFETIYVPSGKLSTQAYHCLRALGGDPHALDIQPGEDKYNIHNLWDRYGNI